MLHQLADACLRAHFFSGGQERQVEKPYAPLTDGMIHPFAGADFFTASHAYGITIRTRQEGCVLS